MPCPANVSFCDAGTLLCACGLVSCLVHGHPSPATDDECPWGSTAVLTLEDIDLSRWPEEG
jgi:hypothetical protein